MTSSSEIQNERPDAMKDAIKNEIKTDPVPLDAEPAFGWTAYAERINGRFAMIGLIVLLILEGFSHQDFLTWLGLR